MHITCLHTCRHTHYTSKPAGLKLQSLIRSSELATVYCMVGNFRGYNFLWFGGAQTIS